MRRIVTGLALVALAGHWALAENESAPKYAFTLKDQTGADVSLKDFAGKIVVLEWVNPECPTVVRHYKAATMKKLAEKYKDKDVVWLAVNTTHTFTPEKNKAFHDQHELPYPVLDDSAGKVGKMFGAKATPHLFILDKEGKLVYNGAIDDDPSGKKTTEGKPTVNYVQQALDELLAGKAVSQPQTKPYGCSVKYAS
ncbi:MAG: thioredoxin family protein [Planctomycetaceae bacterium]|nr:thioredoxin family protein [Planctomycetaceae bacterium]